MKVSEVLALARIPLNDDAGDRYTDANVLKLYNSAVRRALALRPDLQFTAGYATEVADATDPVTDDFLLPTRYAQAVADYVSGRSRLVDDEAVSISMASALLKTFEQELMT